jgi:general L-amino acid transport system permease protein
MRLVILPQAVRVIIPPLISQYLSIVKDSSLGIAIAYPELVSVSNTMINQTGQPIEILTITILVFMIVNLVISALINRYNRSLAWGDRR